MEFLSIFIANPAKLSIKNSQLVIDQGKPVTVPVEDIGCLLIETHQATISSAALSMLADSGVSVFLCDEKHMPCGTILPMNKHSRQLKVLNKQIKMSKPLQKRLWQSVIRQKITNQGECLRLRQVNEWDELAIMAKQVGSGDPDNVEAQAAARYFPMLFGAGFSRGEDSCINSALNYSYAIVRGIIARNLVVYGLEPCLGLFHRSELNQFNLADDLIEPFRPIVDLFVASLDLKEDMDFTPELKQKLFSVTHLATELGGKRFKVISAIGQCVMSLSQSVKNERNCLQLPKLLPVEIVKYE